MRFYEVEAKRILAKQGIRVVKASVAKSAADAEHIAAELGGPVSLEAQVLYPGTRLTSYALPPATRALYE